MIQDDRDWRKLSIAKRLDQPLCEDCLDEGTVTLAEDVHHIRSRSDGGALIVALEELRSLCKRHHGHRTSLERRSRDSVPAKYPPDWEPLVG
jgi:5-methylcytosine-specific restriction endonuclease McrA